MKFEHSLACYPVSWRGTVVSPTKICLQFNNPELKVRVFNRDTSDLVKLPNTDRAMVISSKGTEVDCVAVGCQMPVIEALQMELLDSYVKYGRIHKDTYNETYCKDFKDFLLIVQAKLHNAIEKLNGV